MFQINEQGTREGILKHVQALKDLGPDGKTPSKDQRQIETAKSVIAAELAALEPKFTGAHVVASGSDSGQVRVLNIQVAGMTLKL